MARTKSILNRAAATDTALNLACTATPNKDAVADLNVLAVEAFPNITPMIKWTTVTPKTRDTNDKLLTCIESFDRLCEYNRGGDDQGTDMDNDEIGSISFKVGDKSVTCHVTHVRDILLGHVADLTNGVATENTYTTKDYADVAEFPEQLESLAAKLLDMAKLVREAGFVAKTETTEEACAVEEGSDCKKRRHE
jgi:hypothetical protein